MLQEAVPVEEERVGGEGGRIDTFHPKTSLHAFLRKRVCSLQVEAERLVFDGSVRVDWIWWLRKKYHFLPDPLRRALASS